MVHIHVSFINVAPGLTYDEAMLDYYLSFRTSIVYVVLDLYYNHRFNNYVQVPNSLLQPVPQKAGSDPQKPHFEQHSPQMEPVHVSPVCSPQRPWLEGGAGLPVGVGVAVLDGVGVGVGTRVGDGV
jgi:hypothetical protein